MGSIFHRYRQFLILAILLIYTLAQILSASIAKQRELNWMEKTLLALTAPPQQLCTYLIDKINTLRTRYVFLVGAREDYDKLLAQHREQTMRLTAFEEIAKENVRLQNLLGFKERTPLNMIAARVISLGTSTFTHSVRINKGTDDGLRAGMSVVTAEGVVGHVIHTTSHYANVLLLTDPKSSIDTLDQETRARGIVQGQGTESLRMDFVDRNEKVEVGHTLITSGMDTLYPKGLAVGVIVEKQQDPANIFVETTVKPAVNFSRLEEVLIITTSLEGSQPTEMRQP